MPCHQIWQDLNFRHFKKTLKGHNVQAADDRGALWLVVFMCLSYLLTMLGKIVNFVKNEIMTLLQRYYTLHAEASSCPSGLQATADSSLAWPYNFSVSGHNVFCSRFSSVGGATNIPQHTQTHAHQFIGCKQCSISSVAVHRLSWRVDCNSFTRMTT